MAVVENAGWHRQQIIAAVRMKGSSIAAIGRDIGLKRPTMSWALIAPRIRANRAIADFLGVSMHELWPQWFDADDKLISTQALPRPRPQPISARSYESRHRREAA